MRFTTLLWDMDGTLFDTYPAIRRAIIAAFAAHDVQVERLHVARLLTDSLGSCLVTLAEENGIDPEAVSATYYELSGHIPPETQPPFPGVVDVCRGIVARGGHNLIFTHRERDSLERFLAAYNMGDLFLDRLSLHEGMPRKPDPTGYLTLLQRNKILLADVLVIGDRDLDIEAGLRAGLKTCFFAHMDFPGGVPAINAQPDYTITDYAELADLLFSGQWPSAA